jgi:hypothetical protein
MTLRTIRSVLLPMAVLAVLSCSKTQDTAPERRLFGDPPTIRSVTFEHTDDTGQEVPGFGPKTFVSCDFTEIVTNNLCELGAPGLVAQAGPGWTFDFSTGHGAVGNNPSTQPGIFIQGTYGEAIFKVDVVDPNSTSAQNNLLLVGASYDPPDSKTETTLVLFDDGAITKFQNSQKNPTPGEDCTVNGDGSCLCSLAKWDVTSGDGTANDNLWTRKVAFVNPRAQPFLLDCIMRDRHETLTLAPSSSTFTFKIEAVDRQGNLTTWPSKPVGVTDSGVGNFACNGDSCGCCFLWFMDPSNPECHGLEGMTGPVFPDGLCKAF